MMKCVICKHGELKPGETTVTLQRGGTVIVLKAVPADICDNCGEYYLSEEVTGKVLERLETALRNGAEVEVVRYAA
jgi:YgiT-type zinc finger domain-containing protein